VARGRIILVILAVASFLVALLGLARGLDLYNIFRERGSQGTGLLWAAALIQWLVLPVLLGGAAVGLLNGQRWGRTLLVLTSVPFVALGAMWEFVPGLSLPGFFYPGLAWTVITAGLAHVPAVGSILDGIPGFDPGLRR